MTVGTSPDVVALAAAELGDDVDALDARAVLLTVDIDEWRNALVAMLQDVEARLAASPGTSRRRMLIETKDRVAARLREVNSLRRERNRADFDRKQAEAAARKAARASAPVARTADRDRLDLAYRLCRSVVAALDLDAFVRLYPRDGTPAYGDNPEETPCNPPVG